MAASNVLQEHANFTRLSRLLVDKGTEALRNTLDGIYPPANLPAVLNANKKSLRRFQYKFIKNVQWDLLFPPSGNPPDSKTFDVTLLTFLLRNICWLTHPPATGWNTMPPDKDRSPQANVVRIKLFRNEVYAHVTSTRLDGATFEGLWQKISQALVDLKIPREEIDDLKISALGPEEESYVRQLKEWYLREENKLDAVLKNTQYLISITEENSQINRQRSEDPERAKNEELILQKLAKQNFKSKIERKVKSFHPGTREWLLEDLDEWFETEEESRLLLLTAGPGFGKSLFAAKVCKIFGENGKLGAYHFCDFSNSNLKDPMIMLQSLASQMCENVAGFKELLLDQLKRHHKVCNLNDAFQIFLQNPLDELEVEPFLIVIDGLDESATNEKSDMVTLIADHFPDLPKCVKVLVTSRPELSLQKLDCVKKIEILDDDEDNESDIQTYLEDCFPPLPQSSECFFGFKRCISSIARKCEGSFLYAFHIQRELRQCKDLDTMTFKEIISILPQGLASVYKDYFRRLEIELKALMKKEIDLVELLEMLAAANGPLPLTFVAQTLGLNLDCCDTKRLIGKVNDAISCLLYVSDGLVAVFHKSVYDWLLANGYEDHEYTVKANNGKKQLWLLCKSTFEKTKENIILGNDLKLTNEVQHAFENGHGYLTTSGLSDDFAWLVDMVIMHVRLTLFPETASSLKGALHKVLSSDATISLQLRQRISWHFAAMYHYELMSCLFRLPSVKLLYLETVINYSPEGCFTEIEIKIAKSLVAKVPRCVERDWIGATVMNTLLVKPFPWLVTAVGVSSNKQLAAVALLNGTVFILSLPELVPMWQYSIDYERICCCIFDPSDTYVLFGKLETVLSIENRKEISYFKGVKEQFECCAFSPNGKRLVTSDGSNAIKLWDVVRQCLVSVLRSGVPLDSCWISNTGFFIISNKFVNDKSYCVWNAITFQRVDVRRLPMKSKEREKGRKSGICNRCIRQELAVIRDFKGLERSNFSEQYFARPRAEFFGIYKETNCIFSLSEHFLRVVECIHFTTLASFEIFYPTFWARLSKSGIVDITWIARNAWLVSTNEHLIVFSTGVLEDHLYLSRPTLVVWCSFSPDSNRLATCTSDGFVNLWNVNTGQIYQRVRNNVGTSLAACCWSNDHLFVFHLAAEIPNWKKYHIDENFEIDLTKVELVSLRRPTNEFEELSKVIDFSEDYLSFETVGAVKVLNINTIEYPKIAIFPKSVSIANVAVSGDASVLLAVGRSYPSEIQTGHFILWKTNQCRPVAYDVFVCHDFPIYCFENMFCCFSKDLKFAVAFFSLCGFSNYAIAVDVGTGDVIYQGDDWELSYSVSKVFCTNTILILVGRDCIEVNDLKSTRESERSIQVCLNDDLLDISKLSPNGRVVAIPNVTGGMEFFRLSYPAVSNSFESSWNRCTSSSSEEDFSD